MHEERGDLRPVRRLASCGHRIRRWHLYESRGYYLPETTRRRPASHMSRENPPGNAAGPSFLEAVACRGVKPLAPRGGKDRTRVAAVLKQLVGSEVKGWDGTSLAAEIIACGTGGSATCAWRFRDDEALPSTPSSVRA